MGQAFDEQGAILGETFGNTKSEVFQKLNEAHPNAHEIRITSLADRTAAIAAQGCSTPMPRYQSHKKVWALKIARVSLDQDAAQVEGRYTDGSAVIVPAEVPYAPFVVNAEYVRKHNPQAGGYFVQYEDGYTSFSPAEAFESGYTRL